MVTNKQLQRLGDYEALILKPIELALPSDDMTPQFCRTDYDVVCFGSESVVALGGVVNRLKQNRVYPPCTSIIAEYAAARAGLPSTDMPEIIGLVSMVSSNYDKVPTNDLAEKWYNKYSASLSFDLPKSTRGLVIGPNIRRVIRITNATNESLKHWQTEYGFEQVNIAEITVRNAAQIGKVAT